MSIQYVEYLEFFLIVSFIIIIKFALFLIAFSVICTISMSECAKCKHATRSKLSDLGSHSGYTCTECGIKCDNIWHHRVVVFKRITRATTVKLIFLSLSLLIIVSTCRLASGANNVKDLLPTSIFLISAAFVEQPSFDSESVMLSEESMKERADLLQRISSNQPTNMREYIAVRWKGVPSIVKQCWIQAYKLHPRHKEAAKVSVYLDAELDVLELIYIYKDQ